MYYPELDLLALVLFQHPRRNSSVLENHPPLAQIRQPKPAHFIRHKITLLDQSVPYSCQ